MAIKSKKKEESESTKAVIEESNIILVDSQLDKDFPPLPVGDDEKSKKETKRLIKKLSDAIKEANSNVSTHQKKQIYSSLKKVLSEGSYKQIITGFYLAKKNYDLCKGILAALRNCIEEKNNVIQSLKQGASQN